MNHKGTGTLLTFIEPRTSFSIFVWGAGGLDTVDNLLTRAVPVVQHSRGRTAQLVRATSFAGFIEELGCDSYEKVAGRSDSGDGGYEAKKAAFGSAQSSTRAVLILKLPQIKIIKLSAQHLQALILTVLNTPDLNSKNNKKIPT